MYEQPVSGADEFKTDEQLGGLLSAIQNYGRFKYAEAKGRAEPDLSDVRAAWDDVYEKVQALAAQPQPSGNAGGFPSILSYGDLVSFEGKNFTYVAVNPSDTEQSIMVSERGNMLTRRTCQMKKLSTLSAHGPLTNEGTNSIETLVTQMFTSGNDVPVERITITRQQYEAVLGKEAL